MMMLYRLRLLRPSEGHIYHFWVSESDIFCKHEVLNAKLLGYARVSLNIIVDAIVDPF